MISGRSFLDREHADLISKLETASARSDRLGRIFSDVLKIFEYHLNREDEMVIPLIESISARANRRVILDTFAVQKRWEEFKREYETLLNEHSQVLKLLEEVEDLHPVEGDQLSYVVLSMKRHIEFEESLIYPAAMVVGDLIECSKM